MTTPSGTRGPLPRRPTPATSRCCARIRSCPACGTATDTSWACGRRTSRCCRRSPSHCAPREQLRRNAKLIKLFASGGVLSEVDHPVHQQFTAAELRAIVEVAGMAERAVAAHCHGKPGMMAALEAGVRTIEHGTYMDEEV